MVADTPPCTGNPWSQKFILQTHSTIIRFGMRLNRSVPEIALRHSLRARMYRLISGTCSAIDTLFSAMPIWDNPPSISANSFSSAILLAKKSHRAYDAWITLILLSTFCILWFLMASNKPNFNARLIEAPNEMPFMYMTSKQTKDLRGLFVISSGIELTFSSTHGLPLRLAFPFSKQTSGPDILKADRTSCSLMFRWATSSAQISRECGAHLVAR